MSEYSKNEEAEQEAQNFSWGDDESPKSYETSIDTRVINESAEKYETAGMNEKQVQEILGDWVDKYFSYKRKNTADVSDKTVELYETSIADHSIDYKEEARNLVFSTFKELDTKFTELVNDKALRKFYNVTKQGDFNRIDNKRFVSFVTPDKFLRNFSEYGDDNIIAKTSESERFSVLKKEMEKILREIPTRELLLDSPIRQTAEMPSVDAETKDEIPIIPHVREVTKDSSVEEVDPMTAITRALEGVNQLDELEVAAALEKAKVLLKILDQKNREFKKAGRKKK